MITDKQKYALVNQCRAHSLNVIRKNQQKFLPVFNTGKIFCCDKYRYMGKWHGYAYSADEPEKAFTILYVERMPYKSLYKRIGEASKSFTSSIDKMIFDNELEPFLLFINNRFVPWGKIDIIYDYGETYLKIHGTEYYKDFVSDIKMVILPYNITFLYGAEPDSSFNSNFDALSSYINQSAVYKNDNLYISLPDTDVDYIYDHNTYNVGFWLLNQNKLKRLGVLSQDRIDKLRQIEVSKIINKNGYDETINTTVNIFDKDSYDNVELERLCNICPDNVLLKFNDQGELDDNGTNVIYLVDKSTVSYERIDADGNSYTGRVFDGKLYIEDSTLGMGMQNQLTHVHLNNSDKYVNGRDILFEENFLVFKNGCLCTDCKFDFAMYNNYRVYDIDKSTDYTADGKPYYQTQNNHITILTFISDCDHLITHIDQFPNKKYVKKRLTESFYLNTDITGYKDMISEPLDFDVYDSKLYEENILDSMNAVMDYNPLLLSGLYNKNMYSVCYKGSELNKRVITLKKYRYKYIDKNNNKVMKRVLDEQRVIQIPRMKFDDHHETYPIIFANGELIYNYDELKVDTNKLFLPINEDFKPTDEIEIVYIIGINNNEINIDNFTDTDHCYPSIIPKDELRIFSTDVQDLLIYPDSDYDLDSISFPIYKRTYKVLEKDNVLGFKLNNKLGDTIIYDECVSVDDKFIGRKVTATSCRKFVYQRLKIDRKAYKILLDKRFKYCNNQNQYWLFVNGRMVNKEYFLITIPSLSRPFDHMYIYSTKFFKPTDRIDLFYLPYEFINMNEDKSAKLKENGYIEYNKIDLRYPLDPELYAIFINGKKIPKDDIIRISTDTLRITKDTLSTNNLNVFSITKDSISEIENYMSLGKISKYDALINYIKENLGYDELDALFNEYIKMSNFEEPINADVARIAIINEVIRDFWVTNGYDYTKPFVYDYELNDYITINEHNKHIDSYEISSENSNSLLGLPLGGKLGNRGVLKLIKETSWDLPSLDATLNINIMKYDLHHLYFVMINNNEEYSGTTYIENGKVIENPIFKWAYNDNYNTEQIEYQRLNGTDIAIEDDYEYEYHSNLRISMHSNNEIKLISSNGFNTCESVINSQFVDPIYYGLIDKSFINWSNSNIYNGNLSSLIKSLNKVIQPNRLLDLNNYVIGNNNYFVYAVPRHYAYDLENNLKLTFFLPDIKSDQIINSNRDDKNTPIFTDGMEGSFTSESDGYTGNLRELDKFEMKNIRNIVYTNNYRYSCEYMIYISNGYFTRLYDNIGFNIKVK